MSKKRCGQKDHSYRFEKLKSVMDQDKKGDDKTGQKSMLFPAALCGTLDGNSNKSRASSSFRNSLQHIRTLWELPQLLSQNITDHREGFCCQVWPGLLVSWFDCCCCFILLILFAQFIFFLGFPFLYLLSVENRLILFKIRNSAE